MRANIYTLEPLPKENREAIHHGIEMVAGYIGEAVVAKELTVRLPQDGYGRVNPMRVGLGNLDNLTELHIMAVPLNYRADSLGLAAMGSGFAYVDSQKCDTPHLTKVVSAHETAHAIGFVQKGAAHEDPNSMYHCTTMGCLMNPLIKPPIDINHLKSALTYPMATDVDSLRQRLNSTVESKSNACQSHFCHCCQQEMKEDGQKNLAKLRHNKLNMPKNIKLTF